MGGWFSDLVGPRRVFYWVLAVTGAASFLLIFPKMDIESPGRGVMAQIPGTVTEISEGVVVVETVSMDEPKTKVFNGSLEAAGLSGRKVLFVSAGFDENVFRSARNLKGVEFILANDMNALEILKADTLLFTKDALAKIEEVFA